jgi:hypothetical protein
MAGLRPRIKDCPGAAFMLGRLNLSRA